MIKSLHRYMDNEMLFSQFVTRRHTGVGNSRITASHHPKSHKTETATEPVPSFCNYLQSMNQESAPGCEEDGGGRRGTETSYE